MGKTQLLILPRVAFYPVTLKWKNWSLVQGAFMSLITKIARMCMFEPMPYLCLFQNFKRVCDINEVRYMPRPGSRCFSGDQLSLLNVADYDLGSQDYEMTITVTDSAALATTVTVFVHVAPVNEHTPALAAGSPTSCTVSECASYPATCMTITLEDSDFSGHPHGQVFSKLITATCLRPEITTESKFLLCFDIIIAKKPWKIWYLTKTFQFIFFLPFP